MWLKRLVAVVLVFTGLCMVVIVVIGLSRGNSVKELPAPVEITSSPDTQADKTVGASLNEQVVHCDGKTPCYGPGDLAKHAQLTDCWGYNKDRVIDITALNGSFHRAKSGIETIAVAGVCGKDVSLALGGGVAVDGQTQDHKSTTKNNLDKNLVRFFVGYYDATKN